MASLQVHRLSECAVTGRIPDSKPDPFLSSRVERNAEFLRAKRGLVGKADDLAVNLLSVAPDKLRELRRESPFRFHGVRSFYTRTFDRRVAEQHLSAGHEIVAGAHGIHEGSPAVI